MTKQYKIVANGVTEIVEADLVDFMPQTGQTVYKINNEIVHIAPASALVLCVENKDKMIHFFRRINEQINHFLKENNNNHPKARYLKNSLDSIFLEYYNSFELKYFDYKERFFEDISDMFSDIKSRTPYSDIVSEIEEKIQLIQLKYIAENENH